MVLIQEDMKVCDETVRQILQVGAHLGRHCTMMYKAYSELLLCNDASSMSEMVGELRSRASLTSRNQFCTLASSYVGLSSLTDVSKVQSLVTGCIALGCA